MKFLKLFFLLSLFVQAHADPINTGHADVSIVKGSYINNELIIGIKMDMQEGWHTYWKNPGDSGGPLKVKWVHEKNISSISDVLWPAPELIPYPPLMTYGYENFVIFPFKISPSEMKTGEYQLCGSNIEDCFDKNNFEQNAYIEADIDFLICDDICVPEKALIKTSLAQMAEDSTLINWLNRVPDITLPVLIDKNEDFLDIRFSFNQKINDIYFYIDEQEIVLYSADQALIKEENNWLLKVPIEKNAPIKSDINGVLSINNNSFLINSEIEGESKEPSSISFFQAIIFAFLGGLILNLMPCVFPIISLKILSFVSMGGESKIKIRQHSLSFCFGAILSFLLIGILLVVLKQTGTYLGWGFQLQSPIIVGFLSIVMFAIGIILLTDINLGSSLTKLGGVGSDSLSGSFLTGILAVVVASPCTAPFMGAALGYALIQPSNTTIPVFASLGFGFALPYFLLSIYPNLIRSLPKPGEWMVTLKEFFAFPMFATSLWLIWVFSLQTNIDLLISLLITLLAISLLFWMLIKSKGKFAKLILWLLIVCVIGYEGMLITSNKDSLNQDRSSNQKYSEYTLWSPDIENNLQNENRAYLINFTAAWCITCQANDKIALSRPRVKKYLNDNNIEYIVADWTNKDDKILKALELYERNGVPLYIYWKPGMKKPLVLPSILTEQILLDNF